MGITQRRQMDTETRDPNLEQGFSQVIHNPLGTQPIAFSIRLFIRLMVSRASSSSPAEINALSSS